MLFNKVPVILQENSFSTSSTLYYLLLVNSYTRLHIHKHWFVHTGVECRVANFWFSFSWLTRSVDKTVFLYIVIEECAMRNSNAAHYVLWSFTRTTRRYLFNVILFWTSAKQVLPSPVLYSNSVNIIRVFSVALATGHVASSISGLSCRRRRRKDQQQNFSQFQTTCSVVHI